MTKTKKRYVVWLAEQAIVEYKKDEDFEIVLIEDKFLICRSVDDGGYFVSVEAEIQSGKGKGKCWEMRIPAHYILLIITKPQRGKSVGFRTNN